MREQEKMLSYLNKNVTVQKMILKIKQVSFKVFKDKKMLLIKNYKKQIYSLTN